MTTAAPLFRVQIADLKLERARERRERASIEIDHWTLVKAIKAWESRTGLDHSELLAGDFDNPYGMKEERDA
jgi:hypothetical protein